jgi:hypothetical protein
MEWYYADGDQRRGPMSEEELQKLAGSGKVLPHTLVWRQGMANWQPYASVQIAAAPVAGPAEAGRCAECGRTFSTNDMVHYENSWVCAACKPIFLQRLKEGAPPPASMMLWRSDRVLVMNKEATLPDRCVKCNAPAHGQRLKRQLYWHSPYLYLLVVINLLIYAIVALLVRKKARVEIGLCDAHRTKRRIAIALGWLMGLGGFVTFIVSLANEWWALALISFVVFIAGFFVGARGSMVSAKKIDQQFVWIRGVCRPYLDTLPEWSGGV